MTRRSPRRSSLASATSARSRARTRCCSSPTLRSRRTRSSSLLPPRLRGCTRTTRRHSSTPTTRRSGRSSWGRDDDRRVVPDTEWGRGAPRPRVTVAFLLRHRWLTPYLLLAPGLVWLAIFFLAPLGFLGYQSLQTGDVFGLGYRFTWAWHNFSDAITTYDAQLIRSFEYAAIAT